MKSEHAVRDRRLSLGPILGLLVCMAITAGSLLLGCGGQAIVKPADARVVVDVQGSIEPGDMRDPNHSELVYDAYAFQASALDGVRIEVVTEDFTPLLKLVEVSTGAPLWEWEAEYSDQNALTYTIAGPGTYEARVYSLDGDTGAYHLRVIIDR